MKHVGVDCALRRVVCTLMLIQVFKVLGADQRAHGRPIGQYLWKLRNVDCQVTRKYLADERGKQLPRYTRHAPDREQRHAHVALTTTSRLLSPWLAASAMFLERICARCFRIHSGEAWVRAGVNATFRSGATGTALRYPV